MEAITREEKIMPGENLTPITRKEMFLAKAAGQNIETPEPITREEIFLSKISGGAGGGGASPFYTAQIHWDDMNGAYVLDTPASEILAASSTGLCVLVDTAYNGARTYYWQAYNNTSPLATFMGVDYANKKIVKITVKPDRAFAEREEAIFG